EPIQGEGGVICPDPGYLDAIRKLCNDTGTLLVFDEIQTGIGRTGKLFAYQHFGIEPDIMTLAKALGNGLPIGAMLAREQIMSAFTPGAHASTFGGTPIVTAAASETLRILTEEKIIEHCQEIGAYFKEQLLRLKSKHDVVENVRGMGLLLGMKLKIKGESIVNACMEKGFLINCVQEDILRFIPPLIISKSEIDALTACLDAIL
ncbi:MAG TPA: aspartate aminotransferase family protein, partial [Desulfobacteraceae bacterium]|nr:aspartate aminotransferase family protein [Desulfobacteraceae bacterium]